MKERRMVGDIHDLRERPPGDLFLQQLPDLPFLAVELGLAQGALGAAEHATPGTGGRQPFLGPFRDQVALDLGEEPER
jgi:hypothetical protein